MPTIFSEVGETGVGETQINRSLQRKWFVIRHPVIVFCFHSNILLFVIPCLANLLIESLSSTTYTDFSDILFIFGYIIRLGEGGGSLPKQSKKI